MELIFPKARANWNMTNDPNDLQPVPVGTACSLAIGMNNLWRGVREPIFFGLDDDGYFIAYVPDCPNWPKPDHSTAFVELITPGLEENLKAMKGWEPFPTEEDVTTEWKLDLLTLQSNVRGYWNLGRENTMAQAVNVRGFESNRI